jgi:GNAT superfamily N-acetyltransferase
VVTFGPPHPQLDRRCSVPRCPLRSSTAVGSAAWERPETHAAFVADTEGRVLGFVYTQIADAGHCAANINALFATGEERGHGAGQALLNAALEWCRAHVAHEVSLDCIWPNDLARRFYENRGFRTLLITYVRQLEPSDQTRIRVANTADGSAIAPDRGIRLSGLYPANGQTTWTDARRLLGASPGGSRVGNRGHHDDCRHLGAPAEA